MELEEDCFTIEIDGPATLSWNLYSNMPIKLTPSSEFFHSDQTHTAPFS